MKNFGLIFQYEIKKITHRKLWLIAFTAILLFTIILNLYTIFDYSVGWSGAQVLKANKNNDGLVIDKIGFFSMEFRSIMSMIPMSWSKKRSAH